MTGTWTYNTDAVHGSTWAGRSSPGAVASGGLSGAAAFLKYPKVRLASGGCGATGQARFRREQVRLGVRSQMGRVQASRITTARSPRCGHSYSFVRNAGTAKTRRDQKRIESPTRRIVPVGPAPCWLQSQSKPVASAGMAPGALHLRRWSCSDCATRRYLRGSGDGGVFSHPTALGVDAGPRSAGTGTTGHGVWPRRYSSVLSPPCDSSQPEIPHHTEVGSQFILRGTLLPAFASAALTVKREMTGQTEVDWSPQSPMAVGVCYGGHRNLCGAIPHRRSVVNPQSAAEIHPCRDGLRTLGHNALSRRVGGFPPFIAHSAGTLLNA